MVASSSPPSFLYFTRHTLGVLLLLLVVPLWVSANFFTWSLISHDETYPKPYLVTYVNSVVFTVYLIPWIRRGGISELRSRWSDGERPWSLHSGGGSGGGGEEFAHIGAGEDGNGNGNGNDIYAKKSEERLGLFATIGLSAEFSILWWLANYCFCVCYIYTSATRGSVAGSTSSESLYPPQNSNSFCSALLCSSLLRGERLLIAVQVYGPSSSVLCFVLRDLVGQKPLLSWLA